MTLLYSTILALTLIVFSGVLYTTQSQRTMNIIKDDLSMNARRVALGLARAVRDLIRRSSIPRVPGLDSSGTERPYQGPLPMEVGELRGRDTTRLLRADGADLDLTVNEGSTDLPLSQEGLARVQSGQPWTEIVPAEEERFLVHSEPVIVDGEIVAIVQVARTLADRDRSLRGLEMALIAGSVATTLIAFVIGWVLAGITLRPIHRITHTAMEIGRTRDFSSRVQYRGPNDELGRLAKTFNGMLSRLQGAYQQVARSLQMQRDFVADVSHELRTPLTTIRGNLALLRREPPVAAIERVDILEDLTGESERLIRLVSNLLTLARADAGRKLDSEPVLVKPLIDDVCRQVQLLKSGQAIEYGGRDDVAVWADRDALKQILLTLLDNAITHAEGPIYVTVDERDHQVTMDVRDSGPGMSPEQCGRIFDRFYRGDGSRSTPGFGLGLSIAKALVEAQEGSIEVDSQVGVGSTFTVAMPQAVESR
jgi:two-component system OmpR family sensor kinase